MKRRELLWMFLPCLVFALAALWMRAREQRGQPANLNGPFRIFIERIEKRPISAKDAADGYDTEVVAVLNHTGIAPAWWGHQNGNTGSSDNSSHLFYQIHGKSTPVKLQPDFQEIFYWRPDWKSEKNRYEARFFLKLAQLPRRAEKTVLRAKIAVEDSSTSPSKFLSETLPLEYTVRAPGEVIKAAQISHDPMLEVTKVEIKKPSPAEQKTNGGDDTEVRVYLLGKNESGSDSMGGDELLNEYGKPVSRGTGWSISSGTESRDPSHPVLNYGLSLKAIPRQEKTVIFKTKYSRANHWPLRLRIPLRQGGKDLSGIVQALPEAKYDRKK